MFPCILYFFIHPQPNNIGPARQLQPRDWGSLFKFSESRRRRGAQLLLISFATTRLHGICNGSNNRMEDGGGGGHRLQPHSLGTGISAPHPPQISEFCLGLVGGTKVFYPPRPDYRIFEIPSFTSPRHTHSPVCAPRATVSFSRNVGDPLSSR